MFNKFLQLQSLSALQKFTYANKISGSRGKILDISSIALILRNPVYVKSTDDVIDYLINTKNMSISNIPDGVHGIITYGKTNKKQTSIASISNHNGIIDGDIWLETQSILERNSSLFPREKTGKKALLSGILKCKICGQNMRVSYKKSKNGSIENYYYICGTKKTFGKSACECSNLPGKYLDDMIINEIINLDANLFIKKYDKSSSSSSINSTNEFARINTAIKLNTTRLERLTKRLYYIEDDIGANSVIAAINTISAEIKELKEKLSIIESNSKPQNDITLNNIVTDINNFKEFFINASIDSKRNLLNNIVSKLEWDSDCEKIDIHYSI